MLLKKYKLYIMRCHYQVRAKQTMLGSDWYVDKGKQKLTLYKNHDCPDPVDPEIKNVEKYEIYLDVTAPNLRDLYTAIREVCPEFDNKRSFHLYWKYSVSKVLPVSNHISYLSMVSLIANKNNDLYLVAREWDETWLNDTAATYVAIPEDVVLVNMTAPRQSAFTAAQENQLNIVKSAARAEFTRTYSPPARVERAKKGKETEKAGKKDKEKSEKKKSKKSLSPKSKGTKKK